MKGPRFAETDSEMRSLYAVVPHRPSRQRSAEHVVNPRGEDREKANIYMEHARVDPRTRAGALRLGQTREFFRGQFKKIAARGCLLSGRDVNLSRPDNGDRGDAGADH